MLIKDSNPNCVNNSSLPSTHPSFKKIEDKEIKRSSSMQRKVSNFRDSRVQFGTYNKQQSSEIVVKRSPSMDKKVDFLKGNKIF